MVHVEQDSDDPPFLASNSFPSSPGFFSYMVDRDAELTRNRFPNKGFEDFEIRKSYLTSSPEYLRGGCQ